MNCVPMKNITLSLDKDVLLAVRRYAVEHGSSVNRLVRNFLSQIAEREDRARHARQRIRVMSGRSKVSVGTKSWRREQLHEG